MGEIAVDLCFDTWRKTTGNDEPFRINLPDRSPQRSQITGKWLCPRKIDICRLLEHRICNLDPN
ncbi:MAG: hypothetical protein ABW346_02535, partial [Terrimicrobium sp.]